MFLRKNNNKRQLINIHNFVKIIPLINLQALASTAWLTLTQTWTYFRLTDCLKCASAASGTAWVTMVTKTWYRVEISPSKGTLIRMTLPIGEEDLRLWRCCFFSM